MDSHTYSTKSMHTTSLMYLASTNALIIERLGTIYWTVHMGDLCRSAGTYIIPFCDCNVPQVVEKVDSFQPWFREQFFYIFKAFSLSKISLQPRAYELAAPPLGALVTT